MRFDGPRHGGNFRGHAPRRQQEPQQHHFLSPDTLNCLPAGMQFQPLQPSVNQASMYMTQQHQQGPQQGYVAAHGWPAQPLRAPPPPQPFMGAPPPMMMIPSQMAWGPIMMGPPGIMRGHRQHPGATQGAAPPRRHLPTSPPFKKRKKAQEGPLTVEKLTVDPVVRTPKSAAEKEDIDRWIAARKRNFPTADNISKRKSETESKDAFAREQKRKQLQEILEKQQALGITKQAGTADLVSRMARQQSRQRARPSAQPAACAAANMEGPASTVGDGSPDGPDQRGCELSTDQQACQTLPMLEDYASDEEVGAAAAPQQPEQQQVASLTGQTTLGLSRAGAPHAGESTNAAHSPMLDSPARNGEKDASKRHSDAVARGTRGPGRPRQQRRPAKPQHGLPAPPHWADPRRPSLLEKLLEKDIRRDREHIVQAIEFFVENNFLLDYVAGKSDAALWFPEGAPDRADVSPPLLEAEDGSSSETEDDAGSHAASSSSDSSQNLTSDRDSKQALAAGAENTSLTGIACEYPLKYPM